MAILPWAPLSSDKYETQVNKVIIVEDRWCSGRGRFDPADYTGSKNNGAHPLVVTTISTGYATLQIDGTKTPKHFSRKKIIGVEV